MNSITNLLFSTPIDYPTLKLVMGISFSGALILTGLLFISLKKFSPCPRPALPSEKEFIMGLSGERVSQPFLLDQIEEDNDINNDKSRQSSSSKRITDDKKSKPVKNSASSSGSYKRVDLSVIIPAYNESKRLPIMLDETLAYLKERQSSNSSNGYNKNDNHPFTFEIIVIDDGSKDKTSQTALEYAKSHHLEELKVLTLEINRGKGGAVTQGMLAASGDYMLFVDADGATRFKDIELLESEMKKIEKNGLSMAVGSRAHMAQSEAVRSFIRNFLMHAFHTIIFILGIQSIRDTQCGFKLFSRKAAQHIFPNMHVERWIFDIECILIAQKIFIPIAEVPVTWQEIDGSKMNLMKDAIKMMSDLLVIRANYFLGTWTVRAPGYFLKKSL